MFKLIEKFISFTIFLAIFFGLASSFTLLPMYQAASVKPVKVEIKGEIRALPEICEKFFEEVINSKDFADTKKPISKMFDRISEIEKFFVRKSPKESFKWSPEELSKDLPKELLLGQRDISEFFDKLIDSLDSRQEHVKRNASLALFTIGSLQSFAQSLTQKQYKNWASKVNEKNFPITAVAPDGSVVYILGCFSDEGSMIYAKQPSDKLSEPVKHKTLSEKWLSLDGNGLFALKNESDKLTERWRVSEVRPGSIVEIDPNVVFQFWNKEKEPMTFAIITRPPYKDGEAVQAQGYWPTKVK